MSTIDVRDDTGLSAEAFARIRDAYWVLAFAGEPPYPWAWLFGVGDEHPRPVPNPQMHWRRPTYEEACERQQRMADPDDYVHERADWAEGQRWRWRGQHGVWRESLFARRNEYGAEEYVRDVAA